MTSPQPLRTTAEKPLTSIDYIAALEYCTTAESVRQFRYAAPAVVQADNRFIRAVQKRLAAIVVEQKRK